LSPHYRIKNKSLPSLNSPKRSSSPGGLWVNSSTEFKSRTWRVCGNGFYLDDNIDKVFSYNEPQKWMIDGILNSPLWSTYGGSSLWYFSCSIKALFWKNLGLSTLS